MKVDSDKLYEWHLALELARTLVPLGPQGEAARAKLEDVDYEIYRAYLDAVREECA